MASAVHLTLLGKPGCHLCDDAREIVFSVRSKLAVQGITVEVTEYNILEDPELARLHSEDIPVVFVEGRRHAIWRVDPAKLSAAILKAHKKLAWPRLGRRD